MHGPDAFTLEGFRSFRATYMVVFQSDELVIKHVQRVIQDNVHRGWLVPTLDDTNTSLSIPRFLKATDLSQQLQRRGLNPLEAELWICDFELVHADLIETASRVVENRGPNDVYWSMFCTDYLGTEPQAVERVNNRIEIKPLTLS